MTKYIPRFRDAKLLAKSVGMTYSQKEIIDKFLNSLYRSTLYASSILNFQTQRRNEELAAGYSHAALTLSEIEMSLLSLDENNGGRHNAHSVNTRFQQRINKNKDHQQKYSPHHQQQNRSTPDKPSGGCFTCGDTSHWKKDCPVWKKRKLERERQQKQNKIGRANAVNKKEKEIDLSNNDDGNVKVNMAYAKK